MGHEYFQNMVPKPFVYSFLLWFPDSRLIILIQQPVGLWSIFLSFNRKKWTLSLWTIWNRNRISFSYFRLLSEYVINKYASFYSIVHINNLPAKSDSHHLNVSLIRQGVFFWEVVSSVAHSRDSVNTVRQGGRHGGRCCALSRELSIEKMDEEMVVREMVNSIGCSSKIWLLIITMARYNVVQPSVHLESQPSGGRYRWVSVRSARVT